MAGRHCSCFLIKIHNTPVILTLAPVSRKQTYHASLVQSKGRGKQYCRYVEVTAAWQQSDNVTKSFRNRMCAIWAGSKLRQTAITQTEGTQESVTGQLKCNRTFFNGCPKRIDVPIAMLEFGICLKPHLEFPWDSSFPSVFSSVLKYPQCVAIFRRPHSPHSFLPRLVIPEGRQPLHRPVHELNRQLTRVAVLHPEDVLVLLQQQPRVRKVRVSRRLVSNRVGPVV